MYEIIYLEPDAEITSVIDRLKNNQSKAIALVVPRGATLVQSIVNLKLLKRSAKGIDKQIAIVSTDKISRNLAAQIGLTVFAKAADAEKAAPKEEVELSSKSGLKVNNYYSKKIQEPEESNSTESSLDENEEGEDLGEYENDSGDDEDIDSRSAEAMRDREDEELRAEVRRGIDEEVEEAQDDGEAEPRDNQKQENMEIRQRGDQTDSSVGMNKKEQEQDKEDPMGKKKMKGSKKVLTILVAVIVVVALAAGYIFIPYATAKVDLKTSDLKFEKEVIVDADVTAVNTDKLTIPGKLIEVEKEISNQFNATGTKDMGEKATGKITISNNLDSVIPQIIAKGSKFSAGGKIFISDTDVTAPIPTFVGGQLKAGTVDVNVTAENAGEDYNIGPSGFTITSLPSAKQASITGKSAAAMTGGVTKQVKIVSDKDLSDAQKSLQDLASKSSAEVNAQATTQQLSIFPDAIKSATISSAADKKSGDEAETFTYTMKVKFSAIGFAQKDLVELANDTAKGSIKQNEMLISNDDVKIETALVSTDYDNNLEKLNATGDLQVGTKIAEADVMSKIKGKNVNVAQKAVESTTGVAEAKITIKPSLFKMVPFLKNRIKITFGFVSNK